MPPPRYVGPRLPRTLLDQVESSLPHAKKSASFKPRKQVHGTRKEKQQFDRSQKNLYDGGKRPLSRQDGARNSRSAARAHSAEDSEENDSDLASLSELEAVKEDQASPILEKEREKHKNLPRSKSLKSLHDETTIERRQRGQQTSQTQKPTRAVREKLAEDDAEIAKLEKQLGIKNKKSLPKSFEQDGLDLILGDIGQSDDSDVQNKRKRENQDWLENKRRKLDKSIIEREDEASLETFGDESEDEDAPELDSYGSSEVEEFNPEIESGSDRDVSPSTGSEDGKEDSDEVNIIRHPNSTTKRVRENPYIAPGAVPPASSAKYIPPSRRINGESDIESTARLNRQLQGLLNRLSEANIISIVNEVEALYQNNARQFVTSTLINLLLTLLSDRSVLSDTFIILHAGFIAAIFKVVGTDFGAQLLEELTTKFDQFYEDAAHSDLNGKELTNLVSLLSQLYILQVVGPEVIFDYIRIFLNTLSELHTELLLRIIKYSGAQLRQDDPSSLKDIVIMLQKKVSQNGEAQLSVRTRFMIETINDLKNNRMKAGVASSAMVSEHITRMKKTLGSLSSRNLKATEPLHISLNDIRNSDKRGKWWLVGASWKGNVNDKPHDLFTGEASNWNRSRESADAIGEDIESSGQDEDDHKDLVNIPTLARNLGMNTTIRRTIFTTLITSSDYKDAYVRLLKLHLNRKQEVEIPRVLLRCATAESSYNAYYTLIARKLCGEKRLRMAFQFSLWDFFKQCGQGKDGTTMDEDQIEDVKTSTVVNYAKLFADLILSGSIGIGILKTLDFVYLSQRVKIFAEVLLITIVREAKLSRELRPGLKDSKSSSSKTSLERIFDPAVMTPSLRTGLHYFLKKTIVQTDLVSTSKEKQRVKQRSADIMDLLARGDNEDTYMEDM